MISCINGQFVDEDDAKISIFDRGFLYGDGCFETLRVWEQKPAFWNQHIQRLTRSLQALQISLNISNDTLAPLAQDLIEANQLSHGVLRIQVTRGQGPRGYSTRGAKEPTCVITFHPLPPHLENDSPSWTLGTSRFKLDSSNPIHTHKTSNKLLQVLGKSEAEENGVDDVLFVNAEGHVIETSSANIFWLKEDQLYTPPLHTGALPGITRRAVLEVASELGQPVKEQLATISDLQHADGLLLTQSVWELITVNSLDGQALGHPPFFATLRATYQAKRADSCQAFPNSLNRDQLIVAGEKLLERQGRQGNKRRPSQC